MNNGTKSRLTKYVRVYVVQGHYGQGWEDLCCSEDRKEAKDDLRAYNENETGFAHRRIVRRVKREAFEKGEF